LERLVKRRLKRYTELDCLIPDSQFDFRKGRSCDDCVSILNLDIYNSFIKGEYVEAILLNIKSAYDKFVNFVYILNEIKNPLWL